MLVTENIFSHTPSAPGVEEFATLAKFAGVRIERILSTGQASPEGFWYDQSWTEWVMLLAGSAGLRIEGEAAPRVLRAGDYLEIPPHVRHRVDWTDAAAPTIWLAVHGDRESGRSEFGDPEIGESERRTAKKD